MRSVGNAWCSMPGELTAGTLEVTSPQQPTHEQEWGELDRVHRARAVDQVHGPRGVPHHGIDVAVHGGEVARHQLGLTIERGLFRDRSGRQREVATQLLDGYLRSPHITGECPAP